MSLWVFLVKVHLDPHWWSTQWCALFDPWVKLIRRINQKTSFHGVSCTRQSPFCCGPWSRILVECDAEVEHWIVTDAPTESWSWSWALRVGLDSIQCYSYCLNALLMGEQGNILRISHLLELLTLFDSALIGLPLSPSLTSWCSLLFLSPQGLSLSLNLEQ